MRLFIAVELPDEIKETVREILQALSSALRREKAEIKWVKPEQFHLTLKFLGECMEDQVPQVVKALETAVQGGSPFQATLGRLGCFPETGHIRIIWVGLKV